MKVLFPFLFTAMLVAAACGNDGTLVAPPPPSPERDGGLPGIDAGPPDADSGPGRCTPAQAATRFTVAVVPDTQYLFDQDRGDANVLAASVQWIIDHACEHNIVFVAGLGDITQNAKPDELAAAADIYTRFEQNGIPYSMPAGNHDITRSSQADDARPAAEPYLARFSAARFAGKPTFGGATENGYNSYHRFDGAGQKWLLFALDWRMSPSSMQWVRDVMAQNPTLPAILTMHELVDNRGLPSDPPSATAALSGYGQTVWDGVIKSQDQVFLTINGHFWTPARTTLTNAKGHDVHLHLANYQDRYFGGSAMIRLYEFDMVRGTVEVSTRSPYMASIPKAERNAAQEREVELRDADNRFIENIDFKTRFADFRGDPASAPHPLPVERVLVPGTLAYWRFENAAPGPVTAVIPDRSGRGNDLTRVTAAGGAESDLSWTGEYHSSQPSRGSLYFAGAKNKPPSYLRTADGAALNASKLEGGYTIEAFVKLPGDCCGEHAWMAALSRFGTGADAGKTGDDPKEPLATLSFDSGRAAQWAVFPMNVDGIKTNWSHLLPASWQHVALVNDGRHTVMYIDGARVLANPKSESIGISTIGTHWMVGAGSYDRQIEQAFYGWLGDVRIVDRALSPVEFMTARP